MVGWGWSLLSISLCTLILCVYSVKLELSFSKEKKRNSQGGFNWRWKQTNVLHVSIKQTATQTYLSDLCAHLPTCKPENKHKSTIVFQFHSGHTCPLAEWVFVLCWSPACFYLPLACTLVVLLFISSSVNIMGSFPNPFTRLSIFTAVGMTMLVCDPNRCLMSVLT